ncbi:MAG: helicase-associated domain-containing protein [Actinobacteria bacterium]|nr:helicase-associated domain-containing protein [Actinomycetota bacterium]
MERDDRIAAAPLVAAAALGLGPYGGHGKPKSPQTAFDAMGHTSQGLALTINSAGATAITLMTIISAFDDGLDGETFAFQTSAAATHDVDETRRRLSDAGLIETSADGTVQLSKWAGQYIGNPMRSLADAHAITTDTLAQMCRLHGLTVPSRKAERVRALRNRFADPVSRAEVRSNLSSAAAELLDQIVDLAGVDTIDAEALGLQTYQLRNVVPSSYASRYSRPLEELAPLFELTSLGIVGIGEWDDEVWLWAEAVPLLDRALVIDWPSVPTPDVTTRPVEPARLPPIVGALDRALSIWQATPPTALKNDEPRLAKTTTNALAKELGITPPAADLLARAAIAIGLLVNQVVGTTGRGRNRKVQSVWTVDEDMLNAWRRLTPLQRWLRLVSDWSRPASHVNQQLEANRHLVVWELANLAGTDGYADEAAFAQWVEHRYSPIGISKAVDDALGEARALGIVPADGPVALTSLARVAFERPDDLDTLFADAPTEVFVQGDFTVLAPPGLDADVERRLRELCVVECDAGALTMRLDEQLITGAVQRGTTGDEIITFLAGVSSVPITDSVRHLIADAAKRADRVAIRSAASVVICEDPADLMTALSIKSAQLTAVADTVAVSTLDAQKLRKALDRRGLTPVIVDADGDRPAPTGATDQAAALRARAEEMRVIADRHNNPRFGDRAQLLENEAEALTNFDQRLAPVFPLALVPAITNSLGR